MILRKQLGIAALAALILVTGCNKDDENPNPNSPTIVSTEPASEGTGIERNASISFTFSKAMDPLTVNSTNFKLKKGSTDIPGEVTYDGTTATFNPTNSLEAGANYTATITTGMKDLNGNALSEAVEWSFTTGGSTSTPATINLGSSVNYVVLAKTAINNSPTSAITGDMGISPAAESYITGLSLIDDTGFATSVQVTGKVYAADMASPTSSNLTTAIDNMNTAYNDAAGRTSPDFFELGTGNIGGKTLSSGVYKWTNTVTVPTDVTLTGGENDIWIFQIAENLTVSSAVNLTLSGGAQAKNIFWQVAGEVTIGTTAHFEGIILSKTGITLATGASLKGRALAQTAVILDSNVVTQP
ncbi:MAG: ice-binding family protein [Bacteroidota bacterium]